MSFEVLGVTVSEPLPVGLQHVRLQPGLNLLYGKNGTGKTRIIEAVSRTLGNAAKLKYSDSRETIHDPFLAGGIHVSKIWDHQDHRTYHEFNSSRNWQEVNHELKWDQWIFDFLDSKPWQPRDKSEMRDPSVSWTVRQASRLGLNEEQWRWLIDQGRWLVNPSSGSLWLCDPSPYDSPLQASWSEASEKWRADGFEYLRDVDRSWMARGLRKAESRRPTWAQPPTPSEISGFWYQGPEATLPMLPEICGLEPAPSWVGYPVLCTDMNPVWIPSVDSVWERSANLEEKPIWDPVTDYLVDHLGIFGERLNRSAAEDSEKLEAFSSEVARIERNTNQLMQSVFETPPTIRIRSTRLKVGYSKRPPIAVEASFAADSEWFPVSELGDAHRRFVTTFIKTEVLRSSEWSPLKDQQMRDFGVDSTKDAFGYDRRDVILQSPTVAVIDEPERGLHASAEATMASAISAIADRVLVATHSVRFLDEAFKHGMAHLVTRNEMGLPEIRGEFPALSESSQSQLRDDLGVGPGELALLTSVFVLVEGIHDQVLIEHFLQQEFRGQRVQVVPMQGTKSVEDLVTSPFIFVATAAPIVICLDNGRQAALEELLAALRNSKNSVDQISLINRSIDKFKTMEMTAVLGLLRQAVNKDQLWRVNPFFFSHRDILEYIPIRYFSDRFSSWDELDKQFLKAQGRTTFQAGDGRRKKDWMADQGINARERDLRRVVKEMAANGEDRPKEFGDLAELLLRVSRTRAT